MQESSEIQELQVDDVAGRVYGVKQEFGDHQLNKSTSKPHQAGGHAFSFALWL
jgi:hypothetical protein